jgi:hypothetical protein
MSQVPSDPELKAIESALGALAPAPSRLDRDRLMYRAGALSRPGTTRRGWAWPSIAALLALVVLGESLLLAARPRARVVERIVVVREPAPPAPSVSLSTDPARSPVGPEPTGADRSPPPVLLGQAAGPSTPPSDTTRLPAWEPVSASRRLQDLVLRFGLDAWPAPPRDVAQSGGEGQVPVPSPVSAGALRRLELEKLLKPGDPL